MSQQYSDVERMTEVRTRSMRFGVDHVGGISDLYIIRALLGRVFPKVAVI